MKNIEIDSEQEERDLKERNLERKLKHLKEVLKDAECRGDYYLEFDIRERIIEIREELRNFQ